MRKVTTLAILAGASLALAACGPKAEESSEAPVATETVPASDAVDANAAASMDAGNAADASGMAAETSAGANATGNSTDEDEASSSGIQPKGQ